MRDLSHVLDQGRKEVFSGFGEIDRTLLRWHKEIEKGFKELAGRRS